jgi:tetratricopeptide (TPR) repeat protein
LSLIAAAAAAAGLCVAGGWWLGELQRGSTAGRQAQPALQRQANDLLERLERGEANEAEQKRLLELLIGLDRKPEATVVLERLADRQPQRWSLRLLLAELSRDQNDRSGAEREVRQLLNLKPDRIEALQLMALLQLEQGRGPQATAQLKTLLEKASKPTVQASALPVGLLLGDLLQRQGQKGEAEALYAKLASDLPRDPRPLLALALLQQERGDTKTAQQSLALARSRQPDQNDPRLDQVATSWGLSSLRGPSPQPPASTTERPAP